MSRVRARAFVEGRVQGVFFRDFVRRHARALGLTGWVRNLPDGRVETLVEGEEAAVRSLVAHLEKGPPYARVARVNVSYDADRGEFCDFSVEH
jgi:acylphosphatase